VRFDGTHPKVVYHKDGASTHYFRLANSTTSRRKTTTTTGATRPRGLERVAHHRTARQADERRLRLRDHQDQDGSFEYLLDVSKPAGFRSTRKAEPGRRRTIAVQTAFVRRSRPSRLSRTYAGVANAKSSAGRARTADRTVSARADVHGPGGVYLYQRTYTQRRNLGCPEFSSLRRASRCRSSRIRRRYRSRAL